MASPTTGRSSARKSSGSKTERKQKTPGGPFRKHDPRINRKGRPKKGETFTDIIRELAELNDVTTPSGQKVKRKRAVVERIYTKAIQEGDFSSIRFLIERVDPPAGEEAPDGPVTTAAQVWAAVIAMVRKATEGHPEVRAKIVKEINAAYPGD